MISTANFIIIYIYVKINDEYIYFVLVCIYICVYVGIFISEDISMAAARDICQAIQQATRWLWHSI